MKPSLNAAEFIGTTANASDSALKTWASLRMKEIIRVAAENLRLEHVADESQCDSYTYWANRATLLYACRMRPIKKVYGSNGPTDAQRREWEALNREINRLRARCSKALKKF